MKTLYSSLHSFETNLNASLSDINQKIKQIYQLYSDLKKETSKIHSKNAELAENLKPYLECLQPNDPHSSRSNQQDDKWQT